MIPVLLLSESPVGNVPMTISQVYGAEPPFAAKAAKYEVLSVPTGSDAVVMVSAADWTASVVVPVTPFSVAAIVVLPGLTPVARPVVLIVAMLILDEAQVV